MILELHMILELEIKNSKFAFNQMRKIIFNRKPVGVQPLTLFSNNMALHTHFRCVATGCCQIEMSYSDPPTQSNHISILTTWCDDV